MLFTESIQYILETGFHNWMNESLLKMNINDVKAEYQPLEKGEPIIWHEASRFLLIHEPDLFNAALYFLEWAVSELPRQWKAVWDHLQLLEKNHGKKAAEIALQDYMYKKDFKY